MNSQLLNDNWLMSGAPETGGKSDDIASFLKKREKTFSCTVPCSAQSVLEEAGEEPEAYYSDNITKYEKYEYYQWLFEKEFEVDKNMSGDKYILVFGGIDTVADIYLNGVLLGKTANMFIEHSFDVTKQLVLDGKNKLEVHIHSVMNAARGGEYTVRMRGTGHRNEICHVRKAPHSFGWDIAPRFVTAGIWRDVKLCTLGNTEITEVYFACSSANEEHAVLQFALRFKTDSDTLDGYKVCVRGECKDSTFEFTETAHFTSMNYTFGIQKPRLWFPFGYGEQNLYTVTVSLLHFGKTVAQNVQKIGLRSLILERSFENGQKFRFVVNGKPFYAKGTNWVALDADHSKDKLRLQKAHELLRECGCNMIRCWGGNVYEDSDFFDMCDEAGILVWQDFSLGNTNYPQSAEFEKALCEEVAFIVKKLRNHASVAVWCTDNEIDYKNKGFAYPTVLGGYNEIIHEVLPKICAEHDPYRVLIKSSPEIPDGFGMFNVPEQHLWGPRAWYKDKFYTENSAKFISEFGFHGCPAVSGLKKYIPSEYLWPLDNFVWSTHSTEHRRLSQGNGRNTMMRNHVKLFVGEVPEDIEEFALISQIYQAEALKFMSEHCRTVDGFSGLLWWNMTDCWPQISDSVVDYYFNKKIAFYYMKRCQRPRLCFISSFEGWKYPVYASNHTHEPVKMKISVTDMSVDRVVFEAEVFVGADETKRVGSINNEIISEQKLFVIKYEIDGEIFSNHFITGFPAYKKQDIKEWFEIIRKLDEPFEFTK